MDASDAAVDDGVMIAFLPTNSEWSNIDLPHMTLVYAGLKSDLGPADFSALVKDTAALALLTRPFSLNVINVATFGDSDPVKVLRFRATPELMAARRYVESWNKSEHPFSAHATIGPVLEFVEVIPRIVRFDKLCVAWGKEVITFGLNSSY